MDKSSTPVSRETQIRRTQRLRRVAIGSAVLGAAGLTGVIATSANAATSSTHHAPVAPNPGVQHQAPAAHHRRHHHHRVKNTLQAPSGGVSPSSAPTQSTSSGS